MACTSAIGYSPSLIEQNRVGAHQGNGSRPWHQASGIRHRLRAGARCGPTALQAAARAFLFSPEVGEGFLRATDGAGDLGEPTFQPQPRELPIVFGHRVPEAVSRLRPFTISVMTEHAFEHEAETHPPATRAFIQRIALHSDADGNRAYRNIRESSGTPPRIFTVVRYADGVYQMSHLRRRWVSSRFIGCHPDRNACRLDHPQKGSRDGVPGHPRAHRLLVRPRAVSAIGPHRLRSGEP